MGLRTRNETLRGRLHRTWVSSLGVQSWLLDAVRAWLAEFARHMAEELAPRPVHEARATSPQVRASNGPSSVLGDHPRTPEALRALISHLRETLLLLDDVEDYLTVGEVDDDMYNLWKELERKMQLHRQSEARFQLREMFRI